MCSGSSNVSELYAYNHASGHWAEFKTVNPTDGTRDKVVVGNDEYVVIDINGADMVSIASGSLSCVSLAFSTF